MKVGSVVECIRSQFIIHVNNPETANYAPVKGQILTVTGLVELGGGTYLTFAEMPPKNCYDAIDFRELEFPPDLEKEIEELLEDTVVL